MPALHQDEPVMVTAVAGSGVAYVLSLLVTHGVITNTQASGVTQQAVSIVAAALVLGLGALARRFVTPAAKVAGLLEREGLLTDADWARLEALVQEQLGIDLTPDVGDEHPDAVAVGPPESMQAPAVDPPAVTK